MLKARLLILIFLVMTCLSLHAIEKNDGFSAEKNEERLFAIDLETESMISELNTSLHTLAISFAECTHREESCSSIEITYNPIDTQSSSCENTSKKHKSEHPGMQHIN